MSRIGKYLSAEQLDASRHRIVNNSGEELGRVEWFGRWRQYVFNAAPWSAFNNECLRDITAFLERLNRERKARPQAEAQP